MTADKHGAMRAASQNGKTEVVKLLMARKPSQEAIQFGICGALGEGHVETARAIVELADEIVLADVEVANAVAAFAAGAGMADLLQLAIDQGARAGENGSAVLLDAVEKGQTDIVKFVLALPAEHGVDVAASSEFAVQRAAELGHAEILRLLIAHGADPFVLEGKPARLASTRNRSETFRLLLDLPGWSPEMLDGVVGEALSVAAEDGLKASALSSKPGAVSNLVVMKGRQSDCLLARRKVYKVVLDRMAAADERLELDAVERRGRVARRAELDHVAAFGVEIDDECGCDGRFRRRSRLGRLRKARGSHWRRAKWRPWRRRALPSSLAPPTAFPPSFFDEIWS